jgi:hypothetical protein
MGDKEAARSTSQRCRGMAETLNCSIATPQRTMKDVIVGLFNGCEIAPARATQNRS